MQLRLTAKQKEYINHSNKKTWNLKGGATRSGKTYMDLIYTIPNEILRLKDKEGLSVMIGTTLGSLTRNIINPLRKIYGDIIISEMRSSSKGNICKMWGEEVHCFGAEKANGVNVIRGSSIKLIYGDEVATWHESIINDMLISRLDREYSVFHGTYNPAQPTHWLKKYIDDNADDVFHQQYSLFDNDFLPISVRDRLVRQYQGTVFYDRYVLGNWKRAEGVIYRAFADNPDNFIIDIDTYRKNYNISNSYNVGVDFGKSKSDNALCATIIDNTMLTALHSQSISAENKIFDVMEREIVDFLDRSDTIYSDMYIDNILCDNAEPTYIHTLNGHYPTRSFRGCMKEEINNRIRATNILMGLGRFKVIKGYNDSLIEALQEAVWDDKHADDVRLDDGSTNIDILDAFEYSFERNIKRLVRLT